MKRLYVDDKLHELIKKVAVHEGRTLEWIVNEALETYLSLPMRPVGQQTPRVTSLEHKPSYGSLESLQDHQKKIRDTEPRIIYDGNTDLPELPV